MIAGHELRRLRHCRIGVAAYFEKLSQKSEKLGRLLKDVLATSNRIDDLADGVEQSRRCYESNDHLLLADAGIPNRAWA